LEVGVGLHGFYEGLKRGDNVRRQAGQHGVAGAAACSGRVGRKILDYPGGQIGPQGRVVRHECFRGGILVDEFLDSRDALLICVLNFSWPQSPRESLMAARIAMPKALAVSAGTSSKGLAPARAEAWARVGDDGAAAVVICALTCTPNKPTSASSGKSIWE